MVGPIFSFVGLYVKEEALGPGAKKCRALPFAGAVTAQSDGAYPTKPIRNVITPAAAGPITS